MYNVLQTLHILTGVVVLGWLAMQTMLVPRALRQGPAALETLRFSLRATKVLVQVSLLVYLFGISMLLGDHKRYDFGQTWLNISMLLYFVLLALLWFFVRPVQARAVQRFEQGQDAPELAGRAAMWGGVANLVLLVIVYLMVAKPA